MDPQVFAQSKNLLYKVVNLYYRDDLSQQSVARELHISVSTVSRLLEKAREAGIVRIEVLDSVSETIALERELSAALPIREVIVAPSDSVSPVESRMAVALEGARYLQNAIADESVLGIGHGGTMLNLFGYLNPCRKSGAEFVTLHGNYESDQYREDIRQSAERLAKIFGGRGLFLDSDVYVTNDGAYEHILSRKNTRAVQDAWDRLTITVSGIGSLYPSNDSRLRVPGTIECPEVVQFIEEEKPCGDMFQQFFDSEGHEMEIGRGVHVLAIPYDLYRRVPTKIAVVAGAAKAQATTAAISGGLVDVLVVDKPLAKALLSSY